jgi:lipoprotein-anchoring transpeptidase ErfK/SrfK
MRRAALAAFLSAIAASSLAASAFAQDSPPTPPAVPPLTPQPAPTPKPKPVRQRGKITLEVKNVAKVPAAGPRAYVLTGDLVTVVGHVKPFVGSQRLRVRITSPHSKRTLLRTRIYKGKGEGTFTIRFRVRREAVYTFYARHDRTRKQATFQARISAQAVNGTYAGPGSRGVGVALLKQGLRALGYPAGSGPSWTDKLGREIMAFRKTNFMSRVFTADHSFFRRVFAGQGAFKLVHPDAGKHVEFDWSRQVLALAEGDKVVATYHASSGSPVTPTVFGEYHFYLKGPGTNAKGMYMSNYFIRGYAIHGYPSVPTYPASHGCIRVPNSDANAIYNWIAVGDPIFVYL